MTDKQREAIKAQTSFVVTCDRCKEEIRGLRDSTSGRTSTHGECYIKLVEWGLRNDR